MSIAIDDKPAFLTGSRAVGHRSDSWRRFARCSIASLRYTIGKLNWKRAAVSKRLRLPGNQHQALGGHQPAFVW